MIALLYFFIMDVLPLASHSTYHDSKTNTIILQQDIAYLLHAVKFALEIEYFQAMCISLSEQSLLVVLIFL